MPQHRCTIEFGPSVSAPGAGSADTAGDLHGWTETFYRSQEEASTAALVAARNLATLRRGLLPLGWRVVGVKVSVFPTARTATRSSFTPADGNGAIIPPAGVAGIGSEEAYDALTVNISSASGRSRVLSLRGLPSGVVSPGSRYLAPGFFTAPLGLWSANLITNFSIRVAEAPVKRAINAAYISTVQGVNATRRTPAVVVPADQPLGLNVPIRISGVLGMSGLNGVWTTQGTSFDVMVGTVASRAYLLRQKRGREIVGTYVDGGEAWVLTYSLSSITAVAAGYGTSRRTGSFSTRPRGRRSTRR